MAFLAVWRKGPENPIFAFSHAFGAEGQKWPFSDSPDYRENGFSHGFGAKKEVKNGPFWAFFTVFGHPKNSLKGPFLGPPFNFSYGKSWHFLKKAVQVLSKNVDTFGQGINPILFVQN